MGNHDNHRVATRFGNNKVDGFNMLISLLPGIAVTYNGEEIGMEDGSVTWEEGKDPSACNGKPEDFNESSRDFERTPFHWDDSINAGFNEGANTWLPVSNKYKSNNLLTQSVLGVKSHYHVYKKVMKLRKSKVLIDGDYEIVGVTENTLALRRTLAEESIILIFNLSDNIDKVNLVSVFDSSPLNLTVMFASVESHRNNG